jgi:hypothetical protein
MAYVTLVIAQESRQVSGLQLIRKCKLFQQNLSLVLAPYNVHSSVSLNIFNDFVSALEDREVQITKANSAGLILLVTEFGFDGLADQLSVFHESQRFEMPASTEVTDLRKKVASLEELIYAQDLRIAALQAELSVQVQHINQILTDWFPRLCQVETNVHQINEAVRTLRVLSETEQRLVAAVQQPQEDARPPRPTSLPFIPPMITHCMDSRIISHFPGLFSEFQSSHFSLLWRGSRDGFRARDFHSRCDGHGNTLTVIRDANGNVFGGYTPLTWESRERIADGSNRYKADDTLRSWVFTLQNPHNIDPRKFVLESDGNRQAIFCGCSGGPEFGIGCDGFGDIAIRDRCNEVGSSSTSFG